MSRTRLLKVQFDLSNPCDALTYTRLKESSHRAGRSSIALQARYLLRVMMGVRLFESIERAGLTEVPDFPTQANAFEALLGRTVKKVAARVIKLEQHQAERGA